MSENLIRARSTVLFLLAMLVAGLLVYWIERSSAELPRNAAAQPARPLAIAQSPDLPPLRASRPLTAKEMNAARLAWKYFELNTDPATGLVHSVDKFESTTMWDSASAMLAMIAALRLEIIDQPQFDQRIGRMLASLARLPLVDNALPNKSYHTGTLAMVDYENKPAPDGIGWSALDVGRLLVPLQILVWQQPQHTTAVTKFLRRLDLQRIVKDGQLYGGARDEQGRWKPLQEGRLGYEQYGARGYNLLGLDVSRALDWRSSLEYATVYEVAVPHDRRSVLELDAVDHVASEPYVLDGLEFGADSIGREFAWRVYQAQERRFVRDGVLTAATEDHLDRPPFFVYNTVYSGGRAWNALTPAGQDASAFRTVSVKAAFGWHALYNTEYTTRLVTAVSDLADPQRGWFAGRYEKSGEANRAITCNTNAVVLESLAYVAGGRLLQLR